MAINLLPPGARKGNKNFIAYGWWNGRPFERSLKTADPEKARTEFLRLELRLREEQPPDDTYTFAQAIADYRTGRDIGTQPSRWLADLERELGSHAAASITNEDLWRVAVKLYPRGRPETRNRQVLVPAAAVLHHAHDMKGQKTVPWLRVKKFKEAKPATRSVTPEVKAALLAATTGHQHALLAILFHHGFRIGEALGLQWQNIDLATKTFQLQREKGGDWSHLPMQKDVHKILTDLVPVEARVGRVFSWGHRSNVYRWLRPLCRRLRVRFTPHMGRHTMGTEAINDDVPLPVLMEMGGWKDIKSVLRYGRIGRSRVREALDRGRK